MEEITKRLADAAANLGPQAWSVALRAATVEGYASLESGGICLAVGVALLYAAWRVWRWAKRNEDEIYGTHDGAYIASLFLIAVGATLTIIGASTLLDPWTWTAIYHPDIYIAHKLMKL